MFPLEVFHLRDTVLKTEETKSRCYNSRGFSLSLSLSHTHTHTHTQNHNVWHRSMITYAYERACTHTHARTHTRTYVQTLIHTHAPYRITEWSEQKKYSCIFFQTYSHTHAYPHNCLLYIGTHENPFCLELGTKHLSWELFTAHAPRDGEQWLTILCTTQICSAPQFSTHFHKQG